MSVPGSAPPSVRLDRRRPHAPAPGRHRGRLHRLVAASALATSTLALGGCLIGTGRSIEESGTRVPVATMNQVEAGSTTEDWLVANVGEPTQVTQVGDDEAHKILRYDSVVDRREGGYIFLLYAGASSTRTITRAYFEVKDGVVIRHWTEGAADA